MPQISFTVTVAEEQARQASSDADNPTFASALSTLSAATEAAVMVDDTVDGKPLHPMFRRMSTSSSRSRSASLVPDPGPPKKGSSSSRANGRGRPKVDPVKEEVIEVLSSEDEDVKPARRPKMKRDESDLTPLDEVSDPLLKAEGGAVERSVVPVV